MTDASPAERLERAILAFLEEFMDEREITVAAVVGVLHVAAYEVLRQNDDRDRKIEAFPKLNWHRIVAAKLRCRLSPNPESNQMPNIPLELN